MRDKTLLNHVIDTSLQLNPDKIIVVVGYKAKMVKESIKSEQILFSLQAEQKGTGHAIMQTREHLDSFDGDTLILSGDVPLIKKSTLFSFVNKQLFEEFDYAFLGDIHKPQAMDRAGRIRYAGSTIQNKLPDRV